jgi:hypothetical protein
VSRGGDDAVHGFADTVGGLIGVGLAGIEPGDDGGHRDGGCEVRGPGGPGGVGDDRREVAVGEGGHLRLELGHDMVELGFAGGVLEQ